MAKYKVQDLKNSYAIGCVYSLLKERLKDDKFMKYVECLPDFKIFDINVSYGMCSSNTSNLFRSLKESLKRTEIFKLYDENKELFNKIDTNFYIHHHDYNFISVLKKCGAKDTRIIIELYTGKSIKELSYQKRMELFHQVPQHFQILFGKLERTKILEQSNIHLWDEYRWSDYAVNDDIRKFIIDNEISPERLPRFFKKDYSSWKYFLSRKACDSDKIKHYFQKFHIYINLRFLKSILLDIHYLADISGINERLLKNHEQNKITFKELILLYGKIHRNHKKILTLTEISYLKHGLFAETMSQGKYTKPLRNAINFLK